MRGIENESGVRLFCGPAVIAAVMHVTGEKAVEAAQAARLKCNLFAVREIIRGMGHGEVGTAIRILGGSVEPVKLIRRPTRVGVESTYYRASGELLRDFIKRTFRSGKTFIVSTVNHYIAVDGALIVDTRFRRPTWVFDAPTYLRRRIVWAIEVEWRER